MSLNADFHINDRISDGDLVVNTQRLKLTNGERCAVVKLRKGSDSVTFYMDSLETLEEIVFQVNALIMEIREEGWVPSE